MRSQSNLRKTTHDLTRCDFHSHILPKIDDGSTSSAESADMLEMLSKQGVETVCLTPHYYHHRESINDFLRRRNRSVDGLHREIERRGNGHKLPTVLVGAEVKVESDLINENKIKELCFSGTNSLLMEMPFVGLESRTVETMENIAFKYDLKIVIAHLNRYLDILSKDDLERVIGIPNSVIQMNAEAFKNRKLRKYIIKLLEAEVPIVLGSDAHGIKDRKPEIESAYSVLEEKLSQHGMHVLSKTQRYLLEGATEGGIFGYAY